MPKSGTPPTYTMRLSLNVLNHLGINLYSNVAAVLSEIVANSWDADADHVWIEVKKDRVVLEDDGDGMSLEDINDRFLFVGYRRREDRPPKTKKGRHVFGRKGIGKLSLFSVADIIQVYTVKDGERNAFEISVPEIKKQIAKQGEYNPRAISPATDVKKGTRVVLKKLRRQTAWSVTPLRRRIARRFSILGPAFGFQVLVNDKAIGVGDRGYEKKIQFLWTFGDDDAIKARFTKRKKHEHVDGVVDTTQQYKVEGWIGAVARSGDLDEGKPEEGVENNNKITVLAWGKLIQEDILEDFREGGLYTKYLIGEIRADFLDLDAMDDIATSSREKVIQEDPRYATLKVYLLSQLKHIKETWAEWRTEGATEKALENPAVASWYNKLKSEDTKKYARTLFEKIQTMPVDEEDDRRELYKHGILAFERLQMRDGLARLEQLDTVNPLTFAAVFTTLQDIEGVMYYDIASERMEVIRTFEKLADDDAKEKAIQTHLFQNLWLLHPSWDRAARGSERFESIVDREFKKVTAKLTPDEKKARFDIKYKTAAGKHIIVELKRRKRKVAIPDLMKQIEKYVGALKKCLAAESPERAREPIEVIVVLGERPDDSVYALDPLAPLNARVVTYNQLIEQALEGYEAYLKANRDLGALRKVIDRL